MTRLTVLGKPLNKTVQRGMRKKTEREWRSRRRSDKKRIRVRLREDEEEREKEEKEEERVENVNE